jgi:hypothetical protein
LFIPKNGSFLKVIQSRKKLNPVFSGDYTAPELIDTPKLAANTGLANIIAMAKRKRYFIFTPRFNEQLQQAWQQKKRPSVRHHTK